MTETTGIRYRYRGTDRRGVAQFGVTTLPPGDLAAFVQARYERGWRALIVCAGDGPLPPRPGEDTAAEIGKHPDGGRTWFAESG